MRTPEDVRATLRTKWDRNLPAWLAEPSKATVSVPLHPPTAAQALADPPAVSEWVQLWRRAPEPLGLNVQWEERRWAHLGSQRVPVRWGATGADVLTECAGGPTQAEAELLRVRYEAAVSHLAHHEETPHLANHPGVGGEALRHSVAAGMDRSRAQWLRMSPTDADLSIAVAAWLLSHPRSGLRIRQVPFPGMHTKWLRDHRSLVSRLVGAARADGSEDLGLASDPVFHDVLVLDPRLRQGHPGFPRSSRIAVRQLPDLGLTPRVVIVCENAETVQVLPDIPEAVAVSGSGYAIPSLLDVPWIRDVPVIYWGDLDADGFRILDRARHHHDDVTSILMDANTLEDHRALAVTTSVRPVVTLSRLTGSEQILHDELATGGTRLEQERIELGYAVTHLEAAVMIDRPC